MTPNKLPPLPERLLTFLEKHGGWQGVLEYVTELEALRQSQSLPAGAVAEIGELNGTKLIVGRNEEALASLPKGTKLYALQADAREKGEAVVSDAAVAAAIKARDDFFNNPANYYDCPTCNGSGQVENDWCPKCGGPGEWSDITDEDGMREAIKAALATQPAQASEASIAEQRAADPCCTKSFRDRLAELAEIADEATEGQWFATNHVETSGSEAEFISWCSPLNIKRLLAEYELFRAALHVGGAA